MSDKPSEKVDIFMPMFVADYLADTTDLSTEEHGAYLLLMFTAWRSDGVLPNDPRRLARIAKVPFERWPDIWEAIGRFFSVTGAAVSQGRLVKELARARAHKEAAIERGKRGAAAKAAKKADDSTGEGTGAQEQGESKQRASSARSQEQGNSPPSPPQGSLSLPGSGSASANPDPTHAIPGGAGEEQRSTPVLWEAADWLFKFKEAWEGAKKGLYYGRAAGDPKATLTLEAILLALPREARIAAQMRAALIFAEFLADDSPKAHDDRWQFSYFVLRFNSLRNPKTQPRAGPSVTAGAAAKDAFASARADLAGKGR